MPRPRQRRATATAALALAALAFACSGATNDGRADTRTATPRAAPLEPAPAPVDASPAAPEEPPVEEEPAEPPRVPPTEALELTFVGDIIFGRYREDGYDPIPDEDDEPFAEIKALLASDVAVGNLETPMIRDLPDDSPIGSTFRFGADAEDAKHLVDAGLTALSLANNHAFDLRVEGMEQTPEILRKNKLIPLGAARTEDPLFRLETVERKNWRIGFLAVTSRRNAPDFEDAPRLPFITSKEFEAELGPLIDAAQETHDAVFVVIHWGDEYADAPANYQQRYARKLIDRGATGVIGHHPHVLQGIERYKHGVIAYSLGNFLFENTNEIPRLTGILRLRLEPGEGCIDELRFHPAYIKRYPTPHPVPAEKGMGKVVRRRVRDLSKELGKTALEVEEEDLVLRAFDCPPVPIRPEPESDTDTDDTDGDADTDADADATTGG